MGRTGVEWRRGFVLHRELRDLRVALSKHRRQQRQSEVDSRSDSAARDAVSIDHNPLRHRLGTEDRECIQRSPMGRGLVATKQPRGAKDE